MKPFDSAFSTSATLLQKMKDPSESDWERFYDLYQGIIYQFALQKGCSARMADEVRQATMVILFTKILPKFNYNPERGKFRSYLSMTVMNVVRQHWRENSKRPLQPIAGQLEAIPTAEPEHLTDQEMMDRALKREAYRRVKEEYARRGSDSFQIFEALLIEERSVEDVATTFGKTENNVYQIKSRVTQRLNQVLRSLSEGDIEGLYEDE